MKRRSSRKMRRFAMPEVNLTPLIDTALTLLVIFMVAAPMIQNNIKVDLPQGNTQEVKGQQELVISITKEEKLFFNSYPVQKDQLVDTVIKAQRGREDVPVYVQADEVVPYGKVVSVVDSLKGSVKFVALSIRRTAAEGK